MDDKVKELVEWGAKKLWEAEYEPNYPYRHGWGVANPMVANICREKIAKYLSYIGSYPDLALIDKERDLPEWVCSNIDTVLYEFRNLDYDKYDARRKILEVVKSYVQPVIPLVEALKEEK